MCVVLPVVPPIHSSQTCIDITMIATTERLFLKRKENQKKLIGIASNAIKDIKMMNHLENISAF